MCPKAKSDRVVTHRIEFQETEREALEMIAASITARNVSESINNVLTPFTQASVAGISFALALAGAFGVAQEAHKSGLVEPEDIPPFFFGLIPGSIAYGARNINWGIVRSEFDRRMQKMNPPSL
jgi:hypothetical protein